ncbi:MAG: amidohydrolase family protein [Planctomycetes bacterium]|nr:amidohydrolase family protein [Planctomycetota bacterium]MCH9723454.1 amidohydrolase family protein [Planctomycetota bacterium]MCH9775184.1 amidohydrolase family protein [Planctomycetota bacterium]
MIIQGSLVSSSGTLNSQIRIEGDRIIEVGSNLGEADVSFSDDCLIFAGMGDIHIHARDDVGESQIYKEDFCTAGAAAMNGGVVHVADMPNNPIPPITDESYHEKSRHLKKRNPAIHFTLYAGIGPGTRPLSFAVPYKAYMGPSVGDLFFKTLEQLDETLSLYRGCDVSFHCEDPILLEHHAHAKNHEDQRPAECEISATRFALQMIEKYDLKGKLCHYSVGEGLPLIREARSRGLQVTCEVTPHHLYFDQSDLTDQNRGKMQMNPPLRTIADRQAMLDALREGTLDYLATDHAPHTLEENEQGISGQPHLDTYGAFVTWLILDQNFAPEQAALFCSENPGNFVNPYISPKKFGKIEPGYTASLTVLNMHQPVTIKREDLKTKCGWSPFEGITFPGSVEAVFIEGRKVR